MPTYDEIIAQSHLNVKALSEKLKGIDKLHHDIQQLHKNAQRQIENTGALPKKFERQFAEIVKLSTDYTNNLGQSTKKYLDGNNKMLTNHLGDFSGKIKNLNQEVSRLKDTNLEQQFENFQEQFIQQARKDLAKELQKIDVSSKELQAKVSSFRQEVNRLENLDLEQKLSSISEQNTLLKKQIVITQIVSFMSLVVVIIILMVFVFK